MEAAEEEPRAGARSERTAKTKRRLLDAAMHRFARQGFRGTRLSEIASDAGVSRAALLKHFSSKDDLFFQVHQEAVLSLPAYLDAPPDVIDQGFFATFRYWIDHSDHLTGEDFDKYMVELIGRYSTELPLQERITRFWLSEDPEKTIDFVDFGKDRGEVDPELDPYVVAALLDWVEDGLQRSMLVEELDRGLFHKRGDDVQERRKATVDTMMLILRRALSPAGEPV
jgi:AcrR family transcriptional regulator